ncbi:MAG: tripartite tricarboxylate transporter permease, partial [Pseudomonadota bacterium]
GTTAILLGALIALNVNPGPQLLVDRPEVFWSIIISMYIGNLVLLILNLPLIPYIAKVLAVPRNFLIPFVLFFALIGAYIGQNNPTELYMMVGIGLLATVFRFTGFPLPPLVIGFILGGMLEDNFGRAISRAGGIQFIWERPLTLILLMVAVLLLVAPFLTDTLSRRRSARQQHR